MFSLVLKIEKAFSKHYALSRTLKSLWVFPKECSVSFFIEKIGSTEMKQSQCIYCKQINVSISTCTDIKNVPHTCMYL